MVQFTRLTHLASK